MNLGVQALGWKLDWHRFRVYLREKYGVGKAYLFIGHIPQHQGLYTSLQQAGFILMFKPVLQAEGRPAKGNVDADLVLKATKVDGVYDADPKKVPEAKMFVEIKYLEVLSKRLAVMDTTAISLCMDNNMPIVVFNLNVPGNLKRVVLGERVGSRVTR